MIHGETDLDRPSRNAIEESCANLDLTAHIPLARQPDNEYPRQPSSPSDGPQTTMPLLSPAFIAAWITELGVDSLN